MNRVKRIVAGALVATAALSTIGGAANAAPAHAVTKSGCYNGYIGYTHQQTAVRWCYYNYNWWEETFLTGAKDGWYYEYRWVSV